MTEPLLNHAGMHAGLDHERCRDVPEAMERELRIESRPDHSRVENADGEAAPERAALRSGEHQLAGFGTTSLRREVLGQFRQEERRDRQRPL